MYGYDKITVFELNFYCFTFEIKRKNIIKISMHE